MLMSLINKFVTAKVKSKEQTVQGVLLSVTPKLIVLGQSGAQYICEGVPVKVVNPPPLCAGCGLPLGRLCKRCEEQLTVLEVWP